MVNSIHFVLTACSLIENQEVRKNKNSSKTVLKMDLNTILFAGFVVGCAILYYRTYILPTIRINNLKRSYQSIAEPRLLTQVGETDDEFWARVERERARFSSVGNAWAQKQIPVVAIPMNQSFTIEWFGERHPFNTVGLGQMEYHRMSFEIYVQLCGIWSRETSVFGENAVAAAKGQKPFDHNKTWTT